MWTILPWFALYQLGDCTQITFANALRGLELTKPLFVIAFFSYICFCIPLCYVFAFKMGWTSSGVWAGTPIGLTTAGLLFYWRFRKALKEKL